MRYRVIDDGWFIRKPLVLAWASKDLATSAARNLISSSAKLIVVIILLWVEGRVSAGRGSRPSLIFSCLDIRWVGTNSYFKYEFVLHAPAAIGDMVLTVNLDSRT